MTPEFRRQFDAHADAAANAKGERVTKSSEYYGADLGKVDQREIAAEANRRGLGGEFGPGCLGGVYLTLVKRGEKARTESFRTTT